MSNYKAPVRDIQFAMYEVLNFEQHYASFPQGEEASTDMVSAILTEFAKFCENVVAPINREGDEEGCHWHNNEVTTPAGYKEAYQQFSEGGWPSISCDPVYGGQGLPASVSKIICEMSISASPGFSLYTAGQSGAIETIAAYGTQSQRDLYERRLISGEWNATMCLTEPHCGTDLGLLRTKAEPNDNGSYSISGTKIFITGGEHDLTDNIIHIVLARLPDAPKGTKGISLFIVPKFKSDADGTLTERNTVFCGSIEKKMGIKASATCVMNFDSAEGYLLGEANKGLKAMFTFMNASRIATATQGVTHAEVGFQKSLDYAKDRLQMRSLSGVKNPNGPADPIIVHPDVRRMLLTQKAFSEGNRLLNYYLAQKLDISEHSEDAELRLAATNRLDFLTPIAKAFATETGFESANLAVQCFGGHGYIREWGVEQNLRDSRIAMLYEGTTGIQALDLLGRKVLGNGGKMLQSFLTEMKEFCVQQQNNEALESYVNQLNLLIGEWQTITMQIGQKSQANPDEVGAASVNYLMYSGYVCLAYFWAKAALVATTNQQVQGADHDYYQSKIETARFYYDHILPRTKTCAAVISSGANSMMTITEEQLKVW